ncbi:MAG TPA: ABATE domain-containing protein [Gammaproteobacteria bacterium]
MNEPARKLEDIEIVGGHVAVDFVNTVSSWNSDMPGDYLGDFDDFLQWNEMAGLMGPNSLRNLRATDERDQALAIAEVRRLRQSLHEILVARATGRPLPRGALEHLNDVIRKTAAWRRLAADEDTDYRDICCLWDFSGAPAIAALGPVAWKAAELLELGDLERLKECPGENCGWLFLDTSKNRSRQWCSMKTCGNTAKVRRFRERRQN